MKNNEMTAIAETNAGNFETILSLLKLELNIKGRKNLIDILKSLLTLEQMTTLFNRKTRLIEELIKILFDLGESDGFKVMKNFNNFIYNNFRKFQPDLEKCVLKNYYQQIGHLIDNLTFELGLQISKNRFFKDHQSEKQLAFKDSITIHEEIFNHLKMVCDKNFFPSEEMKVLIEKYFEFLISLKLGEIQKVIHEIYYINLLQITSKLLNFFSVILVNRKETTPNENDFFKNIGSIFDNKPDRVSRLVILSIDFLTFVPMSLTKLKVDAFGYIRNFCDKYAESVVANLKKLLMDDFFINKSKMRFSELEINKIYYYWISAHKVLIRNFRPVILEKLDIETIFFLIENNINILFEDNIHPNYLLNILHNIGSLCEIMNIKIMSHAQTDNPTQLANFAKYILILVKKLVRYLKQSCLSIEDLINYLKKEKKSDQKGHFDDFIYLPKGNMMKYIEENGDKILEEELILRNTFSSRFESETLIQHSFNMQSDKSYKFEAFIDDSIVKKIGILNEILVKYLVEYFRIVIMCEKPENCLYKETSQSRGTVYYFNNLKYYEKMILQKIFVRNLHVFNLLICNAKYIEYPRIYESIKFSILEFFCFKSNVQNQDQNSGSKNVLVKFRDIHRLFDNVSEKILMVFIDIYLSSPENYSNNYTLFIDIFSGSGIIDSLSKSDADQLTTARMTIRAFNEVVIIKVIEIMQKRQIEYFDPLSTRIKSEEVKNYAVRILKGIYRKIKYREPATAEQNPSNDVIDIKEPTLKLILVIMEKTYIEPNVMNYLQLLRNIFSIVYRITPFVNYFTEEITKSGIKLINYLFSIFFTNYHELKIMAVELLIFAPVDIRKIFKYEIKKQHDIRRFFEMIELSMDLNETSLIVRVLSIFEASISHLDTIDLRPIFNERINSIYSKLTNILNNRENQFSILKKNTTNESGKLKITTKIIGKLGEFLLDVRDLTSFDIKKSITNLDEFEIEIVDTSTKNVASVIDLKEYIEVLYQELRRLKERPWFNNFYSISLNYLFFCTIKHKRGLEKLFDFLLKILTELENLTESRDDSSEEAMIVESDTSENNKFFDKTFECLFNVIFLMHPFKIADSLNNNSELITFENYIKSNAEVNHKKAQKFVALIMKNAMLNLELVSEEMDLTIFNFVKSYIEKLIFTGGQSEVIQETFLDQLIGLLSNNCIYGINAALYLFKQIILDKWGQNQYFISTVKEKRMYLIKSLLLANTYIDKKMKLKINDLLYHCYRSFLVKCVEETNSEGHPIVDSELEDFFANVKNFEDSEIFLIMVSLSKNEASHYEKFFKGIKEIINRQMNTYMKALKYSNEDKSQQWNFDFLQVIKGLLIKLVYAFDQGKYKKAVNEMNDFAKTVLCFINQIREELIAFDRRERDSKSSTILSLIEAQQTFVNNGSVYYTNFDLKIHVDKYDYIMKEFCIIFEKCTEVVSKFFQNNQFENLNAEVLRTKSEEFMKIRKEYFEQKDNSFNKLMDLCLRCEKHIIKSILKIVPHSIQPDSRDGSKEQLTQFKILLRLFQKNEIKEHNLYIISKLVKNYPKLVNSDGFMQTINANITNNEIELKKLRETGKLTEALEQEHFSIFNAYFRLICSISLKNMRDNARNNMKTFLEKGVDLEISFNNSNSTNSLRSKLLQFINKLSNSQVIEYIKEIIEMKKESTFSIIYDFIKHPNSASLRERLCREDVLILKSISNRHIIEVQSEVLKWNLILKQICRYCPYYVLDSNKFYQFFEAFYKNRDQKSSIENIQMEEFKEIDMKILSYYVCINKVDMDIRNFYIKNFLEERCYNFSYRLQPYISSISEPSDFKYYLIILNKMTSEVISQKDVTDDQSNSEAVRFFINKITICIIDKIKDKNLKDLIEFLAHVCTLRTKNTKSEDLASLLHLVLIVLVRFKLDIKEGTHKEFLTRYLRICWEVISHPHEINLSLTNYSKIIISLMNSKYDIFKELNQVDRPSQLYDFLFNQSFDDTQDEDTSNIWLESVKNLIPICQNLKHNWLPTFLNVHDIRKNVQIANQSSYQNRFWKAFILSKDHLKDHFLEIIDQKFFPDPNMQNHNIFDILLLLLVYVVKEKPDQKIRQSFFTLNRRVLILEKLIYVLRNEQDCSKNFNDKFYSMILIYLKFFDANGMEVSLTNPMMDELLKHLKLDDVKQEPSLIVGRTLKTQTYFMTLLFYLLKRSNEIEKKEFCVRIINYLSTNKIIQNNNAFLYCTQLFQVLYNLLKMCVQNYANFDELLKNANQNIRESMEKKDYNGLYFSLLIYHFILEKAEPTQEIRLVNFEPFLHNFINFLARKKNKTKSVSLDFDEIFEINETTRPREFSIHAYYKFFVLMMLKLLILSYRTTRTEVDFNTIVKVIDNIMKKLPNPDYDLKYQSFLLIKCMICPELIQAPEFKMLTIFGLTFDQQIRILNAAYIDNNYCMKESTNENFKKLFEEYYKIVLHFVRKYPSNKEIPDFWRQVISSNFLLFDEPLKRLFIVEIESIIGKTMFDRLQFFFKNSDGSIKLLKTMMNDNYEVFASIIVYYMRSVEFKNDTFSINIKLNGRKFDCNRELLSSFISLQEIEGSDNFFSVKFIKEILRSQFINLQINEKEEFVLNFIDFLTTEKNLTPHEYNIYLDILFALCPNLSQSELFANLGYKNGKILKIINHFEATETPIYSKKQKNKRPFIKTDNLRFINASFYKHLSILIR